ncbi:hypothetical protein M885DRAFT_248397 [Pelagophyceae sp. CCMP2097]|nr:hypothetical protein M885DRAFT_248397 [Pelagophyceae sp. CCMP2097]
MCNAGALRSVERARLRAGGKPAFQVEADADGFSGGFGFSDGLGATGAEMAQERRADAAAKRAAAALIECERRVSKAWRARVECADHESKRTAALFASLVSQLRHYETEHETLRAVTAALRQKARHAEPATPRFLSGPTAAGGYEGGGVLWFSVADRQTPQRPAAADVAVCAEGVGDCWILHTTPRSPRSPQRCGWAEKFDVVDRLFAVSEPQPGLASPRRPQSAQPQSAPPKSAPPHNGRAAAKTPANTPRSAPATPRSTTTPRSMTPRSTTTPWSLSAKILNLHRAQGATALNLHAQRAATPRPNTALPRPWPAPASEIVALVVPFSPLGQHGAGRQRPTRTVWRGGGRRRRRRAVRGCGAGAPR